MSTRTLGELAEMVKGELRGDPGLVITGLASVASAGPGDITFVAGAKYAKLLEGSKASAAVVAKSLEIPAACALIRVDDPNEAFAAIAEAFAPADVKFEPGVHPGAVVAKTAKLGKGVSVGANAVIEAGASIGDGTVICPLACVGRDARIGAGCLIYPNVTVRERVSIGDRCIIHSGTVIGSDGFGYVTKQGRHRKIRQIGTVVIEDDVEIGACVAVDRARFDRTFIGRGTKIDNLVQVAHNVHIGENCLIVSLVALAGSAHIGNNVTMGGQSAVSGHVTVGDNATIAGRAGVTKDVPAGSVVSGFPAQSHDRELRLTAELRRVPELLKKVKELEHKVAELERKTDDDPRRS